MKASKGPHESYHHTKSKRTKIPTESDDQYIPDEERQPITFYPDIRSEDAMPRLSWRRNTDLEDMARQSHPLYIQEKVDPSWFVNHLIDRTDIKQTQLFAFDEFPEDAKYNWYRHKGNWSNRIIHGDASRVMASFLHREGLKGKVQMIYFDPPYGIKFDSMFQVSTKKIKGGTPADSKSKKAFRDTYKDGIHSYLDSIYHIAIYSRMLLKESGSFFLQISTENVLRLGLVLDEVFGAENRMATIPFATTSSSSANTLPDVTTWLLWYAKNKDQTIYHQMYEPLESAKEKLEHMSSYAMVEMPDGKTRKLTQDERDNPEKIEGKLCQTFSVISQGESTTGRSEPFVWKGVKYDCPKNSHWSVSHEGLENLAEINRLVFGDGKIRCKRYVNEVPGRKINNLWYKQAYATKKSFIVEMAESIIERCMLMATDPGDLVLDPTCGSGVTASVAEKWGRRWITIDANPIPISLCRQRIITAINDWYLTQDSHEGRLKEAELAGKDAPDGKDAPHRQYDPGSGFVYERVPYVSAATLAYGPSRDAVRLLVDKPLKKRGTKRISSLFTVESISPHKYVRPQEYNSDQNETTATILEGIGISGVIIPGKEERWHLDDANTWPDGRILTHQARIRETGEKVAIVLLPDDNTGGVNLINMAAEEASRYLIERVFILAFEFEAAAYDRQTEQRGKLSIHKIKINNDLVIKELAHKENDSSFVMLGEPDIDVQQDRNSRWTVQILGYDTFDPMTSRLEHGSADTVDCWMLDTNYDGQSFFARRIHLPDKSNSKWVKKLKTKLAKKVNHTHWKRMVSLTSMPFDTPKTGRIAVRIITEFGDTMTTIHQVPGD